MNILALIPARMGSSRFPGKPMAKILGKPMIGHVYERVAQAKSLDAVAVATCDEEIQSYIGSIGGKAIMTSDKHERASDRCAEALLKYEEELGKKFDIVVMVQGDEPMTTPEMIDAAVAPMIEDASVMVTNLRAEIKEASEFANRNCIKVVCDRFNNALYFSREAIPTEFVSKNVPRYKQVCIIPFRRDFLLSYLEMEPTPLEIAESVDMNRILEHGYKVLMVPTDANTHAVDTLEDLKKVEGMMK